MGHRQKALGEASPRAFCLRVGWGRDSPWIPVIFNGFSREEKGWELSLYRLPASCHADSPIPADRFLRKEKSSLLRAGYFLRRRKHGRNTTTLTGSAGRDFVPRSESFHHRRPSGPTAVPLPYVPSERITREASQLSTLRDALCVVKSCSSF